MFKRNRAGGTFKQKKKFDEGTVRARLHIQAKNTLKRGIDYRDAVKLPPGEDLNEWIAVHIVDFYNRMNLLFSTISGECTELSCPTMSGGGRYQYQWQDDKEYKKPTSLPAFKYIMLLLDWIETLINDSTIFPQESGTQFGKNFDIISKKVCSRMFRVFVHAFIHHHQTFKEIGAEAHINQFYKHYYFFIKEHNLIDVRELKPLEELNKAFDSQ